MKKLTLFILTFLTLNVLSQKIQINSAAFKIQHGSLIYYLDKDTASYVSVQMITYDNILKLSGFRSDKWHKEKPFGPYYKDAYLRTGYDLGHLTPSNITSYNDTLNYTSFSFFNQAPQLAQFNRGKWAQLEGSVENIILKRKANAAIATGVIYRKQNKYLPKSRIKIPVMFYKILVFDDRDYYCWVGSNVNAFVSKTDLYTILEIAKENGCKLGIQIKK